MPELDPRDINWRRCPGPEVCFAQVHAPESQKDARIAQQARTIARLTAGVESHLTTALRMRIQELEEIVARQNRSERSDGSTIRVADDLSEIDPRCNDDTMACFFCFQRKGHVDDCIWQRACQVTRTNRANAQRKRAS